MPAPETTRSPIASGDAVADRDDAPDELVAEDVTRARTGGPCDPLGGSVPQIAARSHLEHDLAGRRRPAGSGTVSIRMSCGPW